jgi:hypothetical protein
MLIVFILASGVTTYSLMYGAKDFNWHLPREVINHAYWQIYGELNTLDTFERREDHNKIMIFVKMTKILFFSLLFR